MRLAGAFQHKVSWRGLINLAEASSNGYVGPDENDNNA
jgi:hypothetical protein